MDTPEILYHYTDAKGLLGIVDSNQIWASSYRYMHDALEIQYGFDLIPELFPGQLPPLGIQGKVDYSGNLADLSFAESLRSYKGFYDIDILFVSSFSANDDQLSQWRAYGGLHSGYSLGFSQEKLDSNKQETRLIKCCYNKEEQKEEIMKIYQKHLSEAKAEIKISHIPDSFRLFKIYGDHVHNAANELIQLLPKLKHNAFSEEEEWRLVIGPLFFNDKDICYRDGERAIIPYVKIDFNATGLPLKRIIVGPGPHKERNAQSLRQMLKAKGFDKVEVSLSKIPFRAW